jgi:hypothetical protein
MISLATAIGFTGLIFLVSSFQFDSRKKILSIQIIGAVFYTLHYILIGALTGGIMAILSILRNIVFLNRTKNRWAKTSWWPVVFIALFTAGGLLSWDGPLSILPVMGMISGTIARWSRKEKTLRFLSLIPSPFWLVYDFMIGSVPAFIGESFVMGSNLTAITRFDIFKKKK